MSNHNNLKGTGKCNYIGRSKNIRDGTGKPCVHKEMVMKNRAAPSTGSCTKVKENNRGKGLLLAKERLLT